MGPFVVTQQQREVLKQYIEQGGFIFAQATAASGCQAGKEFEQSLRTLVEEVFDAPVGEASRYASAVVCGISNQADDATSKLLAVWRAGVLSDKHRLQSRELGVSMGTERSNRDVARFQNAGNLPSTRRHRLVRMCSPMRLADD